MLLIVIVLVGAFAIWRGIAMHQRKAAISTPPVAKEDIVSEEIRGLPRGETLTEEDTKILAKVVADNPLPADTKLLTEDDARFLVENKVIDEKEVELLLRLEKIIRRE